MIAYLLRHGRPEYPSDEFGNTLIYGPGAGLSREGEERVAAIARAILGREGRPFDRLVSSPYRRAVETALVIAEAMGMDPGKIVEDARLRDTDSTWAGERVEVFMEAWEARSVFDDPRSLESLDELRARMTAAVDEHLRRFQGKFIGFIGHGDPLRAWLYPRDKPFPTYRELVEATFDGIEGIRIEEQDDGGERRVEVIADLVEMKPD